MRKIIITGANGFVGKAVMHELARCGADVTALYRTKPEHDIHSIKSVILNLENIINLEDVISNQDFDTFYHFAWEGVSGKGRGDVYTQLKNVRYCLDCVHVAKKLGCSKIIIAGSVYEREAYLATYESCTDISPNHIYGMAKALAHTLCKALARELNIELIWGSITNVYGAGEISERFINTTLRKILAGKPLQFTSGDQNYDFIYIDDCVKAFCILGELSGKPYRRYVISGGSVKPLKEFILEIKQTLAPERDFEFGSLPFGGINLPFSFFECTELREDTGFIPEVSFRDGIIKTMEWLRSSEK